MGEQHVGVGRVDDGRLGRAGEDLGGVGHEPLVELVVAGDEHGDGLLALAPGPARLLPERGDGAGEAVEHAGVEAADVDAQLQRRGGDDRPQPPGEQVVLDLPALGGQVAAPVGGHAVAQLPGEAALDLGGHHLGPPPAAAEGDRAVALEDQPGHEVGRLLVGRPLGPVGLPAVVVGPVRSMSTSASTAGFQRATRRSPLGRGVVGDLGDGQAAQLGGQAPGPADGGRAEHEGRVRPVEVADPAQAAQQVGHVGAEDPPQDVELVDHHVLQPGQVGGPLGVVGQQGRVQHLGVGQQHGGLAPGPGALLGAAVAVVGGGDEAGQVELEQGAGLVLGQRLGREDAEGGAGPDRGQGGLGDGGLVAERLARRGAGGQHHRAAGPDLVDGRGLVGPQPVDARGAPRPGRAAAGPARRSGPPGRAAARGGPGRGPPRGRPGKGSSGVTGASAIVASLRRAR